MVALPLRQPASPIGSPVPIRPVPPDPDARLYAAAVEAERALLGCLLWDRDLIAGVADLVGPEDFVGAANRQLYACFLSLWKRRRPADFVTLTDEVAKTADPLWDRVAIFGLYQNLEQVGSVAHAAAYCGVVREHAERRRLIAYHTAGLVRAHTGPIAPEAAPVRRYVVDRPRPA